MQRQAAARFVTNNYMKELLVWQKCSVGFSSDSAYISSVISVPYFYKIKQNLVNIPSCVIPSRRLGRATNIYRYQNIQSRVNTYYSFFVRVIPRSLCGTYYQPQLCQPTQSISCGAWLCLFCVDYNRWRTVGFWRPGQEVDSAPLFLFVCLFVFFYENFQKWKAKRSSAYFLTFLKGYIGFLYLLHYLLTFCVNRPTQSFMHTNINFSLAGQDVPIGWSDYFNTGSISAP